jgi:hypothetical protein
LDNRRQKRDWRKWHYKVHDLHSSTNIWVIKQRWAGHVMHGEEKYIQGLGGKEENRLLSRPGHSKITLKCALHKPEWRPGED